MLGPKPGLFIVLWIMGGLFIAVGAWIELAALAVKAGANLPSAIYLWAIFCGVAFGVFMLTTIFSR